MKLAVASTKSDPLAFADDRLLVDALSRAGFQVRLKDWKTDDFQNDVDFTLVRNTWGYHQDIGAYDAWYRARASACLNSYPTFRWNFHKRYLLELADTDLPVVPTLCIPATDRDSFLQQCLALSKMGITEICTKPAVSAGSLRTFRHSIAILERTSVELQQAWVAKVLSLYPPTEDILIQPYIGSIATQGEASLIFFKGKALSFSHAVLKQPKAGDFRVQSQYGGSTRVFYPSDELLKLSIGALEQVPGEWVLARVDLVCPSTQPLIAEVEMIEPGLFLNLDGHAPDRLVKALKEKLGT